MVKVIKLNRKHFINSDNIEKFVIKKDCVWDYRKVGYQKIYKTNCTFYMFNKRLTTLKISLKDFLVEKEK